MKEIDFLNIISAKLADNTYLGDDCAYLKEYGLFVTQDTLVEDVHFSLLTTTPKQLGWKTAAVNLSDLAASAALPLFLTVSLSLPENTEKKFVAEFYEGINDICKKYNTAVIGGDLTRSEKVFVSVCAIGKKTSKYDVSRKNAQPGDVIVVTGRHGDSAAGLRLLNRKKTEPVEFIEKHLLPVPQIEKGIELGHLAVRDFSMMDSSDGLADALYKIAKASNVAIEADFSKIPFNPLLQKIFPDDYKDLIFWGGEDFELVAAIPEDVYKKIDKHRFIEIGRAEEGHEVVVKGYDLTINDISFEEKSFKHFEEKQ